MLGCALLGVVWISCLFGTAESAACTGGDTIGADDFSKMSTLEAYPDPIAIIMAGDWLADCCGVITKWEFKSQVAATDYIDLQVWYDTDVNASEATMLGFIMKETPPLQDVTIDITDPAEQLPIRNNYAIGWHSWYDEVIPFHDNCVNTGEVGCIGGYFWHNMNTTPGPGLRSLFNGIGYGWGVLDYREYAIRVHLDKGTMPALDNLPAKATVERADGLDSGTIFTVAFSDANTFEMSSGLVTVNITGADPEKALECFSINGLSGEVTVVKNLQVYLTCVDKVTLTIEVTDGCNEATDSTLEITITDLKVDKSLSCADSGVLSTTAGKVAVAAAVVGGVACLAVVGTVIYFCWKAKQVARINAAEATPSNEMPAENPRMGSDNAKPRVEAEEGPDDQRQDTATPRDVSLWDTAQQRPSPPPAYESRAGLPRDLQYWTTPPNAVDATVQDKPNGVGPARDLFYWNSKC